MSSASGWVKSALEQSIDRLSKIPEQAQQLGKQGYDAIKNGAAKVGAAMPGSATEAGQMAGNAVNSAEAGVDAAKTAAQDVKAGFKSARPSVGAAPGPVSLDAAMSGETAKARGFKNAGRTPGWTSGTTPPPGAAPAAPTPPVATGTAVEPWNPVTGQRPGPVLSGPQTIEGVSSRVGPTPTPSMPKDLATAGERLSGAGTGGIPPEGKPGFIRNMGGKALGFAGKFVTPAAAGYGVLSEAGDQMDRGEVGAGIANESRNGTNVFASQDLVDSRMSRMKGLMDAGLNAINPLNLLPDSLNPMAPDSSIDRRGKKFGVPQTGARTLAQQPVQAGGQGGPGMIQTNQGMQTPDQLIDGTGVPASGTGAFRRTGGKAVSVGTDGALFGGKLQPLAKNASPEEAQLWLDKSVALQNSEVQGREALRKDLAQIQTGGRSPFDVGSGPAGAIAGLSAYGAMSRMEKNKADLGVRQDANTIARQKANFDMADKNRTDLRKTQEVNRGTMEKELEGYARIKAGDKQINELPGTYESRVKGELAKVRQDLDYSMGNRKDGRKLEDLSGAERQQFFLYKNIKDKVTDSRGQISQKFRDYFGNKQFDSKDAYSYAPTGVEDTIQNGLPALKVRLANGNTMVVSSAAGGGWNLTGPNDPVDADVMALVAPFVKEHEKKKQRG